MTAQERQEWRRVRDELSKEPGALADSFHPDTPVFDYHTMMSVARKAFEAGLCLRTPEPVEDSC